MNHKKHKEPRNPKGQHHGYQEWYQGHSDEIIWLKAMCKNGKFIGYCISNLMIGEIGVEGTEINYHIR